MLWISHPLAYYGLLAASLVLCLYLFTSLKKENAQLRQKLERLLQQNHDTFGEFRMALGELQNSLSDHEKFEQTLTPMPTASPGVSINLTKRSQALRMHRRGDSPEQIGSVLQMPRNEVELLLKVQKALAER